MQIDDILKYLDLKATDLARFMGVAPYTISRWQSGGTEPKGTASQVLNALEIIARKLQDVNTELSPAVKVIGNIIKTTTPGECLRRYLEEILDYCER